MSAGALRHGQESRAEGLDANAAGLYHPRRYAKRLRHGTKRTACGGPPLLKASSGSAGRMNWRGHRPELTHIRNGDI